MENKIKIVDLFDANKPAPYGSFELIKETKKFTFVNIGGEAVKFHRATGYVVGFHWPQDCRSLAKEHLTNYKGK